MKRIKTFITSIAFGALALSLAAFSIPAEASNTALLSTDAPSSVLTMTGTSTDSALVNLPPAGDLDEQEIIDLLWMREEEKVARDVYLTLGEQWDVAVFTNISESEQQHMDAVATLLDAYGIVDPVGDNPVGVFTDPELQAMYDDLVAQGSESLADALKVGATIEEVDIIDLERAIADTDNADIVQVYESLMCGSENHLRAFVSTLEQQAGESYTPQFLDQAAYDAIMAGSNGNNGGNGQGGNGSKGGRW